MIKNRYMAIRKVGEYPKIRNTAEWGIEFQIPDFQMKVVIGAMWGCRPHGQYYLEFGIWNLEFGIWNFGHLVQPKGEKHSLIDNYDQKLFTHRLSEPAQALFLFCDQHRWTGVRVSYVSAAGDVDPP